LLEWKNRVLELAWRNNGYELKIDGKSITLTGADETSVFTPMSYELNGKHSQVKMAFGPASKLPNGDPLPEYYWPPRRSLRCLAFCGQSNSLFSKERMDGPMARTQPKKIRSRRFFSEEFKQEAVQMLLDGHSAPSVAERLGLPGPNVLYRWKRETLRRAGPAARTLGDRVAQLEEELRRVERERDILKKALAILSRQG